MGVIFKARHLFLDKFVVIKTMHNHLSSPETIRRFQLEGKATSILSHPNIAACYDLGVTQTGQSFIIMEFIDGIPLSLLLRREGQLTLARFLNIFGQICEGLGEAHKKSILHRDIKPANIMIGKISTGENEVRITDFGIAKMMNDTGPGAQHLTRTGEAIGSLIYMSPAGAGRTDRPAFRSLLSRLCDVRDVNGLATVRRQYRLRYHARTS